MAGRRFAHPVEAAVYQCLVSAAREFADLSAIDFSLEDHDLVVHLHGTRHPGADLQPVLDRAEAAGGSASTVGDDLVIRIPAEAEVLVD